MSRMLNALKQIEEKQAQRRPSREKSSSEGGQTPPASPDSLITVESALPNVVEMPAEGELQRLEAIIQEELKDWPTVPVLVEEVAYSPSLLEPLEGEAAEVEKTLAQVESALDDALLAEEEDIYGEMAQYIQAQLTPDRPAVLLLTSPSDSKGQSETLFPLAERLVNKLHGEILLVDANFPRPGLSYLWGKAFFSGIQEVFSDSNSWQRAIQETDTPRLSILPNKGASRSEEILYNARDWACLLEQLKTRYQLTLIDAPSLAHEETAAIISQCDGVYLLIRLGCTTAQLVRDAVGVIQEAGGRLLGTIAVGDNW